MAKSDEAVAAASSGAPENQAKATSPDLVLLVFQQNRSFELHAGGTVYRFAPYGARKVPRAVLTDPGYNQDIAQWFSWQEIPAGYVEAD